MSNRIQLFATDNFSLSSKSPNPNLTLRWRWSHQTRSLSKPQTAWFLKPHQLSPRTWKLFKPSSVKATPTSPSFLSSTFPPATSTRSLNTKLSQTMARRKNSPSRNWITMSWRSFFLQCITWIWRVFLSFWLGLLRIGLRTRALGMWETILVLIMILRPRKRLKFVKGIVGLLMAMKSNLRNEIESWALMFTLEIKSLLNLNIGFVFLVWIVVVMFWIDHESVFIFYFIFHCST